MLATEVSELRQDEQQQGARNGMPDQIDHGNGTGSDDVLKALAELESVLRENAESERLLGQADRRRPPCPGEWAGVEGDLGRRGRAGHGAAGEHHLAPAVRGEWLPATLAGRRPAGRGPEHPEHRPPLRRDAPAGVEPAAPCRPGQRGAAELELGARQVVQPRNSASASAMMPSMISATGGREFEHAHDLTRREHTDVGTALDERGLRHHGRIGCHDDLGPGELVARLHGAPFAEQRAHGGAGVFAEREGAAHGTGERAQPRL